MDIEKLIEQANRFGMELRRDGGEFEYSIGEKFLDYATALSTLQAENEKLRVEAEGMRSNWYKSVEEIKKLRAELEWKDTVIELAQRKQREAEAALRREQK